MSNLNNNDAAESSPNVNSFPRNDEEPVSLIGNETFDELYLSVSLYRNIHLI